MEQQRIIVIITAVSVVTLVVPADANELLFLRDDSHDK